MKYSTSFRNDYTGKYITLQKHYIIFTCVIEVHISITETIAEQTFTQRRKLKLLKRNIYNL